MARNETVYRMLMSVQENRFISDLYVFNLPHYHLTHLQ
jgi:hypothetical protein